MFSVPPPRPWVTYLILGSTIIVFLLQCAMNDAQAGDRLGDALAFYPMAFADGRWWTVLTYGWAHSISIFGIYGLHLFANMIVLYNLGPALEDVLGHLRFLGLYLGGTIAAALFWMWTNTQPDGAIIGASGAVFALIAAAGVIAPRARIVIYFFFLLPIPMTMGIFAVVICGLELAQAVFHWWSEIAHMAHLGGAAFGLFYILALKVLRRNSPSLP